jgi:hypothetical protein
MAAFDNVCGSFRADDRNEPFEMPARINGLNRFQTKMRCPYSHFEILKNRNMQESVDLIE